MAILAAVEKKILSSTLYKLLNLQLLLIANYFEQYENKEAKDFGKTFRLLLST